MLDEAMREALRAAIGLKEAGAAQPQSARQ